MSETTSTARRRNKLNTQQVSVLDWLEQFRFSTTRQIAAMLGKSDHKSIQSKLQILEAQGLIAKRYDATYRLAGRPAEYYLTPKGIRALKVAMPTLGLSPYATKALYKNKTVGEAFVKHCIASVDVALKLKAVYAPNLEVMSSFELRVFDYIPTPVPDLYLKYTIDGKLHGAFLDIWDDTRPFFVQVRKIRNYVKHSEESLWPEGKVPFPAILIVCVTEREERKVYRQLKKALRDSYFSEDIPSATVTLATLQNASSDTDEIWHRANWSDGPDPVTLYDVYR